MKRQAQTAGIGASRGQLALSKGFAIFHKEDNNTQETRQAPSTIVIRTLPFIKRKQSEDFKNDYEKPFQEEKVKSGRKEQINSQEEEDLQSRPTCTPLDKIAASTFQSKMSKSQIRFYVHQVGSNFSSASLRRQNKLDPMRTTFGSLTKAGQREEESSAGNPTLFQSTNNDRFSYKSQQKQQQAQGDLPYDKFSQTQKQFFENFMQDELPTFPNDLPVLTDQEIRDDFPFQITGDLAALENPGSSVAFLNGFPHNLYLMKNHFRAATKFKDELSNMKEDLKTEMEEMKANFYKEMEEFQAESKRNQDNISQIIQEDFVKQQTESFALNKEITKLLRDKIKLENEVDDALVTIRKLEDKLYGREIFNVETNVPGFMHITSQNLREDTFTPLSSKRTQFFAKRAIH